MPVLSPTAAVLHVQPNLAFAAAATMPITAHVAGTVATPTASASVAVPRTIQSSVTMATVNPQILRLQPQLIGMAGDAGGAPRASFQLPTLISPTASPTDMTLFEEPQDPTKKHYLPQYAIAVTTDGIRPLKWVSLEPNGAAYRLIVHLADVTSTAIAQPNIKQSAATTRYTLTADLQGRMASWDFGTVVADGAMLKLTLDLGFADRDPVYQAMTDPAAQAKLTIRRSLALALPVPRVPAPQPTAPPPSFSPPGGPRLVRAIYWTGPMRAPEPQYRQASVEIDSVIPFLFSRDLDGNVFAELQAVGASLPAWNRFPIAWNGHSYPYFQDQRQPSQIYFLPDAFKVTRQPDAPYRPSITVATTGDDVDSLILTLSYLAAPVWDPRRIEAATADLKSHVPPDATPALSLFEASKTKLVLSLPNADGSGGVTQMEQPDATIDVAAFIRGSIALKLAPFRQVYDALFDEVSQLFSGVVQVTVNDNVEQIPFSARAADLVGPILDIATAPDSQGQNLVATLRNAIESPIQIDSISAVITQNGASITPSNTHVAPSPPVTLAPTSGAANAVTVTLTPPAGRTMDAGYGALFDLSRARVLPDPKAIWSAILDNQVVGPTSKTIDVKLAASVFKPAAAAAPPPLAVQVVFENGQTAAFDGSGSPDGNFFTQKVRLAVPIGKYVLQDADQDDYRYRVNVITSGGITPGTWTTDNVNTLYVVVA